MKPKNLAIFVLVLFTLTFVGDFALLYFKIKQKCESNGMNVIIQNTAKLKCIR